MSSEPTRQDVIRLLGRALPLPPEQSGLTARSADGSRPIVVALPADPVSAVIERLREFPGGRANVVAPRDGRIVVLVMAHDGHDSRPDDQVLHPDANLGMLLSLAERVGHVRVHVAGEPEALTYDAPHPLAVEAMPRPRLRVVA